MQKAWMLATVLMATGAVAEELPEETKRAHNVVALDVGGLLQNTVGLSAERGVSEQVSLRLGLRVGFSALWAHHEYPTLPAGVSNEQWNAKEASVALEPGVRFFLMGRAPEGFWVGPQLGVRLGWQRWSSVTTGSGLSAGMGSSSRSRSVGGSALAGYSAVLGKGLSLQASAGLGLTYGHPVGAGPTAGLALSSSTRWALQPVTQLSLGYAF